MNPVNDTSSTYYASRGLLTKEQLDERRNQQTAVRTERAEDIRRHRESFEDSRPRAARNDDRRHEDSMFEISDARVAPTTEPVLFTNPLVEEREMLVRLERFSKKFGDGAWGLRFTTELAVSDPLDEGMLLWIPTYALRIIDRLSNGLAVVAISKRYVDRYELEGLIPVGPNGPVH